MKISVYIPSYNQKDVLVEAIDSVLSQTLRPHEIIIVDDASTDGSVEIIQQYARQHDGLIRPIFHTTNQGVARTRIDALQAVTGDAVTYVDGDDRLLPNKLERESEALLRDPNVELVFSNHYNMTKAGERFSCWVEDGHRPPEGDVFEATFARAFPKRDIFRMELIWTESLKRIGFHDPDLPSFEDFDLRIRLARWCRVAYVDEPLAEIRRHGEGLSSASSASRLQLLKQIYRKNRSLMADYEAVVRRRIRHGLFGWMAVFAREAALESLCDPKQTFVMRRVRAARHLAFCARHGPSHLTLADLYRLWLPAKLADRLI